MPQTRTVSANLVIGGNSHIREGEMSKSLAAAITLLGFLSIDIEAALIGLSFVEERASCVSLPGMANGLMECHLQNYRSSSTLCYSTSDHHF